MVEVCGTIETPTIVRSPYWPTTAVYRSNYIISDKGFNFSYAVSDCGGVLQGQVNIVSSPNYPTPYSANVECAWLVEAEEGGQIQVS